MSKSKPSIQKLSQSQIQARQEKGLCFYCDAKYTVRRKCRASVHVLIVPDSEDLTLAEMDEGDNLKEQEERAEVDSTIPQINLHTKSGILMPRTLKFKWSIGKLDVQIHVDGGNMHNFLQSKVVSMLNLLVSSDMHFDVMVGNGEMLKCEGLCLAIPV